MRLQRLVRCELFITLLTDRHNKPGVGERGSRPTIIDAATVQLCVCVSASLWAAAFCSTTLALMKNRTRSGGDNDMRLSAGKPVKSVLLHYCSFNIVTQANREMNCSKLTSFVDLRMFWCERTGYSLAADVLDQTVSLTHSVIKLTCRFWSVCKFRVVSVLVFVCLVHWAFSHTLLLTMWFSVRFDEINTVVL